MDLGDVTRLNSEAITISVPTVEVATEKFPI